MSKIKVLSGATPEEVARRQGMADYIKHNPLPQDELGMNLGLFLSRMQLSRILLIQNLYKLIVPVHGIIMEFGVRWGQNLALFSNLRGMYEPYNYNRKIVGFDTFTGFPSVDKKDGKCISKGNYSVTQDYADYLEKILCIHEADSPISHKKKFELVIGDATETIHDYLKRQPETIISLAYFDFDIYQPTKVCLEAIIPRLTKGSILAFDELNCPEFPGETLALIETLGLSKYGLRRDPNNPLVSWLKVG
jgi:hypothetical protein